MLDIYRYFLFTKHILVCVDYYPPMSDENNIGENYTPLDVIITLGQKFGIRITENPQLANVHMICDAQVCLGEDVPEPFYRGFPRTVRDLIPADLRLMDQVYHYIQTYGFGWFDQPGHSIAEATLGRENFKRLVYNENIKPKEFKILNEYEAEQVLITSLQDMLSLNRPLSEMWEKLIEQGYRDYTTRILPKNMPCKETVIGLLYKFKELEFCKYLKLSDTIKLVRYIQWTQYHSENLKALNLKNQDRKFITAVIDYFNTANVDQCNFSECFEKRKIWCGLFHHIHYKPKSELMRAFVTDIRSNVNLSTYSRFEQLMKEKNPAEAAKVLVAEKGPSALVRHLNYIPSRCVLESDLKEVIKCLE